MFKKKCNRCGRKISKEFDFCPYCGLDFRLEKRQKREEDYGMLGKDSLIDTRLPDFGMKLPLGLDKMFNSILGEMTKQIDAQFKELDKEMPREKTRFNESKKMQKGSGISVSISTAAGKKPEIKVKAFGPEFQNLKFQGTEEEAKIEKPKISDDEAKRLSKLPRKEAEASVRRLSNKIIYEIELPGIKKLKDIIINKLENSVEIKAFTKNTAYFKLLPINLPILNYNLKDSKLIIEFKPSS